VVLVTLGIAAAVVAGAVAVVSFQAHSERVVVHAASPSNALVGPGPVAGTMFVTDLGEISQSTGGITTPGFITVYRPGAYGNVRPVAVIKKGIDGPLGMAVDSSGDLWVANGLGNTVVEYDRAELAKVSPAPTVTLGIPNCPVGVAFDPSGDLWVDSNCGPEPLGAMEEFTKAQLAKSGHPAPVFTLNEADCRFAFDSSGDLWEGSGGTNSTLSEWTKSQLRPRPGSPLAPTPRVLISSAALGDPCAPGFDRTGDLWVSNQPKHTVIEFTKAQLAKSGTEAPKVVISSSANLYPEGLTFDASGNLWVAYQARIDRVEEFTKSELAKSGTPEPARVLIGQATGLFTPGAVAFEP
jgi:DNA-binding beta-propeller fold protein YncE